MQNTYDSASRDGSVHNRYDVIQLRLEHTKIEEERFFSHNRNIYTIYIYVSHLEKFKNDRNQKIILADKANFSFDFVDILG